MILAGANAGLLGSGVVGHVGVGHVGVGHVGVGHVGVGHAVSTPVVAHAVHTPVVAHAVAPVAYQPQPYQYSYAVADDYTGTNFQASESSDGAGTKEGQYTVALPDGRIQNVNYHANDIDGYIADVTYDGVAGGVVAHAAPVVAHAAPVVAHAVHTPVVSTPVISHAVHSSPVISPVVGRSGLGVNHLG